MENKIWERSTKENREPRKEEKAKGMDTSHSSKRHYQDRWKMGLWKCHQCIQGLLVIYSSKKQRGIGFFTDTKTTKS